MPLTIVTVLLVLGVVLRNARWKRRCLYGGLALFLLFSNPFLANELMRAWEVAPTAYKSIGPRKVGVVLTGATIPDIEPSDRVYFHRGADRVIHAVQLYKLGLIESILVSGGVGRIIENVAPEAERFREVMIMMGVPPDDIIIETQAANTHENAVEVARIIHQRGIEPSECLLITSAFHMRRALACFRNEGIAMDPFATDFYAYPPVYYPDAFLIPDADALKVWEKLFKEWIGMVAYKVAGYI